MGHTSASIKKPTARPGAGKDSAKKRVRLEQAERISKVLRTAGDTTRLHILFLLSNGERSVQVLATELGQSQPAISHQLALLSHTNLAASRRQGARNFYSLTGAGQELTDLLQSLMAPGTVPPRLPKLRAKTDTLPRKHVGETADNVKVRFKASDMASWKALNRSRFELIDKEIERGLTAAEGTELRVLQEKADAYLDVVAPLPFGIFDKLGECAKNDGLDASFLEEE